MFRKMAKKITRLLRYLDLHYALAAVFESEVGGRVDMASNGLLNIDTPIFWTGWLHCSVDSNPRGLEYIPT